MADVNIEWIHSEPGGEAAPSLETCAAFRAVLEDLRQQMSKRGIEVAIRESTAVGTGCTGKIVLNGVPLEQIVPVKSVRGSPGPGACPAGGSCGGGSGGQDIPCEEFPESIIRLAIVKAAGHS
jgi:hypothetical protein